MYSIRFARLAPGFLLSFAVFSSPAQAQPSAPCDILVYPAAGVHSVGEDFDAVHQLDQDLKHYYETAGRPLDWLSTARQRDLLKDLSFAPSLGVTQQSLTFRDETMTRNQALHAEPPATGRCVVSVMLPQVFLERGGLATRSIRVFGIVRRYENGALFRSYSGYASAPMSGFQLRSPADANAATAIVEQSYRTAVGNFLANFAKTNPNY